MPKKNRALEPWSELIRGEKFSRGTDLEDDISLS